MDIKVGTRICFLRELSSPANEERPACLSGGHYQVYGYHLCYLKDVNDPTLEELVRSWNYHG